MGIQRLQFWNILWARDEQGGKEGFFSATWYLFLRLLLISPKSSSLCFVMAGAVSCLSALVLPLIPFVFASFLCLWLANWQTWPVTGNMLHIKLICLTLAFPHVLWTIKTSNEVLVFLKPTIRQASAHFTPVIDQVHESENVGRIWTSLLSSLFSSY